MAIQDKMLNQIVAKMNTTIKEGKEKVIVDSSKAERVAEMLTDLAVSKDEADNLISQYIAQIKIICKD